MASSSTSSNQKRFKYHVFLSFRGEDTRKTFVDHIYASLKQHGIHTFRDNEELEKGKQIDQLSKAIEESRFFIIVFSKNYASSSWCLKEVTKIMECQDGNQQIAYPLFYDVEPSDIRKRSGPVETAVAKHKSNEQIKKWEKALEGAGNLVGWDLKNIANGHEAEAINLIVKEISRKLRSIHLTNNENVIGMEHRMQEMESSLGIGLNDEVRMIGIKGMGGVGKTTLARAIFDKVSSHFEGSVFVEDVREVSKKDSLRSLQERVLSGVLHDGHIRVESVYEGQRIMRMRLPYIKVLLVLDDVDDARQLEALAGDWFKDGSRIIITTRDEKVLLSHGVNVNWIHDVNSLSDEEAMSLFSRYAFKRYIPDEGYEKLSLEVVSYAAGLPLTIKVLGSHLRGENELVWRDALKRLETIPSRETLEILEISYNSLEDDHKEMFLDVACFLKGIREVYAIKMLDSCGFHATYGLRILQQKSLITISDGKLGMHDRIEELGKNIVRRSHPHEPNKHSRLWIDEEIEELFSNDAGTESSACIGLELVSQELSADFITKSLGNLNKLRYLCLIGKLDDYFSSDLKFDKAKQYFPNSLQFLFWRRYPFQSLPPTFRANNLVGLELPNSRIVQLWESGEEKVLKKLRFLDLRDSKLRTLDLGMTPNLERLDLRRCDNLTEIYAPAGCLERLVFVNLVGCPWSVSFSLSKQLESLLLLSIHELQVSVQCLEEFPINSTNNLPLLRLAFQYSKEQPSLTGIDSEGVFLDLQPCTKLESVSGTICGFQHLRHLTLEGCIPEVPNDLDQLQCLQKLSLLSTRIKFLPDSICMLKHLKFLTLKDCRYLKELPENLGWLENLEELRLFSTSIRRLPDSICMLKHLKSLQLEYCELLEKLPEDIGQLECLEYLNLTECASLGDIPNNICKMKGLRFFNLRFCTQVKKLPEEFGNLKLLEELDIVFTGISHLPHSISSMNGLLIYGSRPLLRSCAFTTEIETSEEYVAFCYIQAMNSTPPPSELKSQSTENYLKRNFGEHESTNTEINELTALSRKVLVVSRQHVNHLNQQRFIPAIAGSTTTQVASTVLPGYFPSSTSNMSRISQPLQGSIGIGNSVPGMSQGSILGSQTGAGTGTGMGKIMMPIPVMSQQQVQGTESSGVNNNTDANVSLPPQTTGALQSTQSKYVKVWEGKLSGVRQGQPVYITRLKGYRTSSAPESLADNWPPTMQIARLISEDHMHNKQFVGKTDFLVFRAMNQHGFLGQMQEKKLCGVIELPSQTLLLSVSDKARRLIGMLFPADMVVFKPQILGQQLQPPQLRQQMVGVGTGMNQGSFTDHEATDKVNDLNPHIPEPTTNDVTGPRLLIVYKRRKYMDGTRVE